MLWQSLKLQVATIAAGRPAQKGVRPGKTAGQYQDDHDALTLSDSLP
jgi:hypothetical protein